MKFKSFLVERKSEDLRSEVLTFMASNPYPNDIQYHKFCTDRGIDSHFMEAVVYELLCDYMQIGRHNDIPDTEFDKDELETGIKVEYEHIDPKGPCGQAFAIQIAKSIAKDHLYEIPTYYTRLVKMEKSAGMDIDKELMEL